MKQTLLTSFEDGKTIWLGLDLEKNLIKDDSYIYGISICFCFLIGRFITKIWHPEEWGERYQIA